LFIDFYFQFLFVDFVSFPVSAVFVIFEITSASINNDVYTLVFPFK